MPDLNLRNQPLAPRRHATLPDIGTASAAIGRLAIRSLYREAALAPKPGLVTPFASGSHSDMDFRTFLRSLQALRPYFPAVTRCGAGLPGLRPLQQLGIAAERDMLAATGGINTHRGAVFNLGLLCAAAGLLVAGGMPLTADEACRAVEVFWGEAIMDGLRQADGNSHGLEVARRYGSGGARREAASGFPAARRVGLPAYRAAMNATGDHELAAIQALFALIATVEDTNLLWRGGSAGLRDGQQAAAAFLAAGGVLARDWRRHAMAIDDEFVRRRLSPGGSADLLGVTLFLDAIERL